MKNTTIAIFCGATLLTTAASVYTVGTLNQPQVVEPQQAQVEVVAQQPQTTNKVYQAQCELAHESSDGRMAYQKPCTVHNKENENKVVVYIHDLTVLNVHRSGHPGLVTIGGVEGIWMFDKTDCGFQLTDTDESGTTTYTVKGNCN